jgi:hypothetical protein
MSAFGPKRTSLAAPHMSALGGKADMGYCGSPYRGRYWGQSGHALLHCICPLMTQSGHCSPSAALV